MFLSLSYQVIKSASLTSRLFTGAYQKFVEDDTGQMLREQYNQNNGYDKMDARGIKPSRAIASALQRNLDNPDVAPAGSPLTRVAIPHADLSVSDLKSMGFVPSYAAVPERGQSELRTWRHPDGPMHLHKHRTDWMMHADKWPSMAMLRRAEKSKNPDASTYDLTRRVLNRTFSEGIPHALFEGVPGYLNFASGMLAGQPTFDDALSATRAARQLNPTARAVSADSGFTRGNALHAMVAAGLLGSATAAFKGSDAGATAAGGALGLVAGDQLANALQARNPGIQNTGPGYFAVAGGIPLATAAAGALGGRALSKFVRKLRAPKPSDEDPAVN